MKEQQAKALFFAQYLGQKLIGHGNNPYKTVWGVMGAKIWIEKYNKDDIGATHLHLDTQTLLLRSVNQLTDEEKLVMSYLIEGHIHETYTERQLLEVAYRFIHHFNTGKNYIYSIHEVNTVLQYWRSIGILLPFTYIDETGKPVTYSVEEILELGWAQIKTP